jgi:hypothetical protein
MLKKGFAQGTSTIFGDQRMRDFVSQLIGLMGRRNWSSISQ